MLGQGRGERREPTPKRFKRTWAIARSRARSDIPNWRPAASRTCGDDALIRPPAIGFRVSLNAGRRRLASVRCPLWVDTVEKVVSDPPKRNNRIRTARYLNRNCVRGRDFESMLRIQGRKIVFQQYRSEADIFAMRRRCPLYSSHQSIDTSSRGIIPRLDLMGSGVF